MLRGDTCISLDLLTRLSPEDVDDKLRLMASLEC